LNIWEEEATQRKKNPKKLNFFFSLTQKGAAAPLRIIFSSPSPAQGCLFPFSALTLFTESRRPPPPTLSPSHSHFTSAKKKQESAAPLPLTSFWFSLEPTKKKRTPSSSPHSSRPQTHHLHLHQLPPNSPFSSGSSPNTAVSTEPADHKPRPSASVI
jgi:hypothetical protein